MTPKLLEKLEERRYAVTLTPAELQDLRGELAEAERQAKRLIAEVERLGLENMKYRAAAICSGDIGE